MAQTVPDDEQTVCRLGATSGESACAAMALIKPRVRVAPRIKNSVLRVGINNVRLPISTDPRGIGTILRFTLSILHESEFIA